MSRDKNYLSSVTEMATPRGSPLERAAVEMALAVLDLVEDPDVKRVKRLVATRLNNS